MADDRAGDRALTILIVMVSAIFGATIVIQMLGWFFIHSEVAKLRADILIIDNYNQTIERLNNE